MNIFILHGDPRVAAWQLCDAHIDSVATDSVQMLSTALDARGLWQQGLMKPAHKNDPCTKWVCEDWANFIWLAAHAQEVFMEYARRYNRRHPAKGHFELVLAILQSHVYEVGPLKHWRQHTTFVQVVPEKYKHPNAVQAYRNFYICDKVRFARWRDGRPNWMDQAPILGVTEVDCAHGPRRDRAPHPSHVRRPRQGGKRQSGGRRGVNGGGESRPAAGPGGPAKGKHRRAVGRKRPARKRVKRDT